MARASVEKNVIDKRLSKKEGFILVCLGWSTMSFNASDEGIKRPECLLGIPREISCVKLLSGPFLTFCGEYPACFLHVLLER